MESCPLIASSLWAGVHAHAKGISSILHPLLTKAHRDHSSLAHMRVHLEPCKPHQHPMGQDRAPGEGCKLAATSRAAPQPLPTCASTGSWCPLLFCSGEPGHPLLPALPSPSVYRALTCSKAVFAQPSALCPCSASNLIIKVGELGCLRFPQLSY